MDHFTITARPGQADAPPRPGIVPLLLVGSDLPVPDPSRSARSPMPDAKMSPSSVPVGVDTTRASIARVYDAFLGGKDNFEIDREVLRQVATVAPEVTDLAWSNRNFLVRA